jgi:hypothetical protein
VLFHYIPKIEKFFRFAHIPWATLNVQHPLRKSPSSYCNGTTAKFVIAIPFHVVVTTLALGSQPRQGVARLRAKRETRDSFHMLLGVQRVWGNEPSHSQVNSHVGSWSPKWTPESSECDCRGQNSLLGKVLYIIGKILKCRCLKWAHIAHLDIWNTSYGQKKG